MYNNELKHYGVIGMKWGVRRYQDKNGRLTSAGRARYGRTLRSNYHKREEAYQKKLVAISRNKNANATDIRRIKYRQQNAVKRVGKNMLGATVSVLMTDVLSGKVSARTYTNKAELTKRLAAIGAMTFATTVKNEALANSTAKRYNENGKAKKGTKAFISKEDWIDSVASLGISLIPIMGEMTKPFAYAARNRAANQARVDSWGANILPQKVDNIVWQSPDKTMSIIDNRIR